MATTNAGAFTVARNGITINTDNSMVVVLQYTNSTTGNTVVSRVIYVPANSSNAITDQLGNVISATVPAALANAITSFISQVDTTINNGASGGKLSL